MVVGEVIGVGIFLTPAEMAQSLGSPAWLIAVWLIMGASAIGGALTFGGLAARYPEAGGLYVYLREAFGPRVGFLYGWLSMLVTDPGLTAMLAVGLATYVAHLVPLSDWGIKGAAVAAIVLLAGLNMLGGAVGSRVMRGLAGLKIGLLIFLAVWGFASGRGDWSNLEPFWSQRPGSPPLLQALPGPGGLIGAFIALAGWWDVSRMAGEIRDPGRTMPRALVLGLTIVTALYIAVSVAFLYLVSPAQLAADPGKEAFAALAGRALFGRTGEVVFASVVVISVAGSLAAVLMAFPRVYYAMARDGLFFPSFAAVDTSQGTPPRAVALQAALAVALALSGSFGQILGFFMVPTLAFLALAIAGVFVLRRRTEDQAGPAIVVPGYPVTPLLFLIPVLIVTVMQGVMNWKATAIGLAVVAAGVPISMLVAAARVRNEASAPDLIPSAQSISEP
jgi:APA family basic amino acid/polyamine antiporter